MTLKFNCALRADIVLFGFSPEEKLGVLLIERKNEPFKGSWALPGGFVDENEKVLDAAFREMKDETSVKLDKLSQIGVYGVPDRDPRGRVVSVSYFGLIYRKGLKAKAGHVAKKVSWFAINDLPELAFDHNEIIRDGLVKLKRKLGSNKGGIPINGLDTDAKTLDELQMMF